MIIFGDFDKKKKKTFMILLLWNFISCSHSKENLDSFAWFKYKTHDIIFGFCSKKNTCSGISFQIHILVKLRSPFINFFNKRKKKNYHFILDLKSFKLQILKNQIIFFRTTYSSTELSKNQKKKKKKIRSFYLLWFSFSLSLSSSSSSSFFFFFLIIKSLIYRITTRPRDQEEQEGISPIFCCNLWTSKPGNHSHMFSSVWKKIKIRA